MDIRDLNPKSVWGHFYSLTHIPRPSKKEEKAVLFLEKFGKDLGLETIKDELGNIIIRKPATPGMENKKGIVLQAHIDMVPQKNSDKAHDFEKDPIVPRIVDEWVYATGTTLGADNGLGIAVAMSILESVDIAHGPLEALFTIDEEAGMNGARGLKPGLLKGEILINLDSEDEGELYVGCAGGLDVNVMFSCREESAPTGEAYELRLTGLKGGHSGMDISLGRGNANKSLVRILLPLMKLGARLSSIEGGSLRNAIPREGFATLIIPSDKVEEARKIAAAESSHIMNELAATEPDIKIEFETTAMPSKVLDKITALNMIKAVHACPNGVERMSDAMPGLVETSNNLAIVKSDNGEISVNCLLRSSVDSAKEALGSAMESLFDLAGAKTVLSGGYPGWKPNMDSDILKTMKQLYKNMYGKDPEVKAIHAGLECGILGGAYPCLDMISCGPTIRSPHSPDERVNIETVEKWYRYMVEVLKNAPVKI